MTILMPQLNPDRNPDRLRNMPAVMMTGIMLAAGMLLCFGSSTGVLQAEEARKVALRYKFVQDQVVRYDVSLKDDYRIQVGGDTDQPYSHQDSVKNYRVRAVLPDGSAILELTIESVQLEIHQNGETFQFDSLEDTREETKDQPVFQAMQNLVGKPHLQLKISPRGEVSEFVALVDGNQVPDHPEQVAFDVLLRLPEEELAVGDSWREDFEVLLSVPDSMLKKRVRMQRSHTLTKLEGSIATIELQTRVLTILNNTDDEMQLLRRKPGGTVVIDLEKGQLISKHLTQNNEVTGFETGPSLMAFKQDVTETLREVVIEPLPTTPENEIKEAAQSQ